MRGRKISSLFDSDHNAGVQGTVKSFLENQRTACTRTIHCVDTDFEGFLGIWKPLGRGYKKPLDVMMKYRNNETSSEKLDELRDIVEKM